MGKRADEMNADRDYLESQVSRGPVRGADEEDTGEIKADIEQTRAEMSETIDAIQAKLSPQNLVTQAKDAVKEATVGRVKEMASNAGETAGQIATQTQEAASEVASQVVSTVKENPIPAALVGLGLGYLLFGRRGKWGDGRQDYGRQDYYGRQYDEDRMRDRGSPERGSDTRWRRPVSGQSTTEQIIETIKQNPVPAALAGVGIGWMLTGGSGKSQRPAYGRTYERPWTQTGKRDVSRTSAQGQTTVGDLANRAQESVGDLASRTQETVGEYADRAQGQFQWRLQENPLALGAVAVALGAAVGIAVPGTRQEERLMGEARDNLMEKAQEVAQDTMQKVQKGAEDVGRDVKTGAQEKGMTA